MSKISKFQPELITQLYFPDDIVSPQQINYGRCFMWAYMGHETFRNTEIWCTAVHAFLKHRGLYFDSETLNGSANWKSLPANRRDLTRRQTPHHHPTKEFKTVWDRQPSRFNTSWHQMDVDVRQILGNLK